MTKPSPLKYVACATTNRRLLNVLSHNCPEVAKTENIHQNYNVATYIHWKICREYNLHNVDKWYKHNLKTVEERNAITILYDISNHLSIVINNNLNQDLKNTFSLICLYPLIKILSPRIPKKLLKDKDLE